MKMVKYFEESGLLMKGVIEKIQSEAKRLRSMLLKERNGVKTNIRGHKCSGILATQANIPGRAVIREGKIRVGKNFE